MKKSTIIISFGILVSCFSSTALAQGRAWKCAGNYYTNDGQEAKKLGSCKEVGNDLITIVNVGGSSSSSSSSSGSYSNPPPVSGDYKPKNTGVAPAPRLEPTGNLSASSQNAIKLLEVELQNEQNALAKLQQEYNNGQPERLLSETNDDALYKVRVDRLGREIEVKVANIVAIQNEIARLK